MQRKTSPEHKARETLNEYAERYERGKLPIPVPVELIAELMLGFSVERDELPPPLSGSLYVAERRIVVRSHEPVTRQRFTIAHEIGHIKLHSFQDEVGCTGRGAYEGDVETEANRFAAALLMPAGYVFLELAEELGSLGKEVDRGTLRSVTRTLAGKFQVSRTAMGLFLERRFDYLVGDPGENTG